ncbi:hypothetical protein C0J07_06550 [Bordetella avium]|nr:hypothetical protein C0J07_06550 [Bordetella avium]
MIVKAMIRPEIQALIRRVVESISQKTCMLEEIQRQSKVRNQANFPVREKCVDDWLREIKIITARMSLESCERAFDQLHLLPGNDGSVVASAIGCLGAVRHNSAEIILYLDEREVDAAGVQALVNAALPDEGMLAFYLLKIEPVNEEWMDELRPALEVAEKRRMAMQ